MTIDWNIIPNIITSVTDINGHIHVRPAEEIALILTKNELNMLAELFQHVGGDPTYSLRKYAQSTERKVRAAGGRLHEHRSFVTHANYHTIYFAGSPEEPNL